MVGVEVGDRVITLVPVHVDHHAVKRADTRHAPTITGASRHSQEESLVADGFPSSRAISACAAATLYADTTTASSRPRVGGSSSKWRRPGGPRVVTPRRLAATG